MPCRCSVGSCGARLVDSLDGVDTKRVPRCSHTEYSRCVRACQDGCKTSRGEWQPTGTRGPGCFLIEGEMTACAGRVDNSISALYTLGRAIVHLLDNP